MSRTHNTPRPFLKWAGGKAKLAQDILGRLGNLTFNRYHEPFLGGGAIFFELHRSGLLDGKDVFLTDINKSLIQTYMGVKKHAAKLIALLSEHQQNHCKDYFYEVRAQAPSAPVACAARLIYLNKTCYNGLYRENSKGQFNVPFGSYTNPAVCDADNLLACQSALKNALIEVGPFESILDRARPGDLVYFDPPYHPLSKSASFTRYSKDDFGVEDQEKLAEVFAALDGLGAKILLSNSYTPFVRDLYKGYTIDVIQANRHINSRADRRGKIAEALIGNF